MGYIINNIANITEPTQVTLSNNPNFVDFSSKNNSYEPSKCQLTIRSTYANTDEFPPQTAFTVRENYTGQLYQFRGTNKKESVNNSTFLLNSDRTIVAQNVAAILNNIPFFKNNFEITVPFIINGQLIENGYNIYIESIGGGDKYEWQMTTLDLTFMDMNGNSNVSSNSDTIDGGSGDVEIELDIYTNTGIFLGTSDIPTSNDFGDYLTTLSKNYYKKDLWFELNSLLNKKTSYSNDFLFTDEWCNTGTMLDYRFIARRNDGLNQQPFYISNVLFIMNGYDYTLNENDLSEFIYDSGSLDKFKPLTNQPIKKYIQGQTEYFNFIFKDPQHSIVLSNDYDFGLMYKYYTQSNEYITSEIKHTKYRRDFNIINTIKLNPDLEQNKTVGYFTVELVRNSTVISEALKFEVVPQCFNKIIEFAFLNRLGGWSSFNFNGEWNNEFKIGDITTIYHTLTPNYSVSDKLEDVYEKAVEETYTVSSSSIDIDTVEWLRELSASKIVYELSTNRYIIIDKMDIKYNSSDNLYQVDMTYHYSDKFNSII